MEKPFDLQDEVSWISVIFGLIGIILLAVYIIWGPGSQDVLSPVPPKSSVEQAEVVPVTYIGD